MDKVITIKAAIDYIKDDMTVMVGGFLGNGAPETLIDALVNKGIKNLTLICSDTAYPNKSVGKMVVAKQIKSIITSHVGTNPETQKQIINGELICNFVPQGTLVERIRAGGTGLGGFLTPTGIGTVVEVGKQKMTVNGREYLLEMPLRADVALLYGSIADKSGNIVYTFSQRNFNPLMAMAADLVICEAGHIVETGEIDPNEVMTPGILVDYIVSEDDDRNE